jgi:predicted AAA+ superfamily ATPase
MIWYKFTNPNGYYYTPFSKSKSLLTHFDNGKDMVAAINQKDDVHFEVHSENIVECWEKTKPTIDPIDLPYGIYSHSHSNNVHPERLMPLDLRDDNYIELLSSLIDLDTSIEHFINNKSIYTDSKTLYKLGVLLFGPPGTGKTSYMRQFIRSKKDAIVIFLDVIPSRDFLQKLESSTKDKLKIFVIEEVLSVIDDSHDIREMLDFLDGSKSVSNSIYFLSTNYPESIPENVIRNGRIDIFTKVEFPDRKAREKLIEYYLQRNPIEEEIEITKEMPIVDIREICFLHKKTNESFKSCVKIVEEKNKMLKKYFGKLREVKLI